MDAAVELEATSLRHAPEDATLADLLANMGAAILEVLVAPRGLDVRAAGPVVFDAEHQPQLEPGDLVLGVGVGAASPEVVSLVEQAGTAEAAAVLVKLEGAAPASLLEAAERSGIAVLAVSPEMGWAQCLGLVRNGLVGSGAVPDDVGGPRVGDLFGLANAVAAMVGGAVTIEDPHSRVLAYSSVDEPLDEPRRETILGRRVPDPWLRRLRDAGVFRRMWTSSDPVRFEYPDSDLRPRLAIAVRAGSEILGSIWVAEGREPFGPQAEDALREAARVAALHLIRHRTGEDVERQMRADLLRSVLDGRWPPALVAERLGVEVDAPHAVVAFEPDADDEGSVAAQRERALDLIMVYSEAFRRRAATAGIGSVVYALLPVSEPARRERLIAFAEDVVDQAERAAGIRLRAGIGPIGRIAEVPESRREADRALRVARADARLRIADIDEVRGRALLDDLRDLALERPHLRAGKVGLLVEHDRKHGTSYVETLRAYLACFGDVPAAAQEVRVHPNTFRYRLRRLEEIAGMSLADPAERLAAEIQVLFMHGPPGRNGG